MLTSNGSVLVFQVGISFSVFLTSVQYSVSVLNQNIVISVSVFSTFPCLHYFMSVCSIRAVWAAYCRTNTIRRQPRGVWLNERGTNIWIYTRGWLDLERIHLDVCRVPASAFTYCRPPK